MSTTRGQKRRNSGNAQDLPSKRLQGPNPETNDLCERCQSVHTKTCAVGVRANLGTLITALEDGHQQLLRSRCPFCRLLGSIKDPSLDGRESGLYAYSSNATYAHVRATTLKKHDIISSILLGFVGSTARSTKLEPPDFIGPVHPQTEQTGIGPKRVSKDTIDYPMIKAWVSFCQDRHRGRCNHAVVNTVENLRVIDVSTQTITLAPKGCEYVALSYVWGTHVPTDDFPMVVQDSFVVTKELGYRYLWVDKYCIDHKSATHKHEQIKAMHLIYSNSQLTLIAAAGQDSGYGLPGVGSRQRIEQNTLSVGGSSYIRTFPHAAQILGDSRWATRGWTLQEGILSRRRLVFTDHHISYQCNGMHCSEAIRWPYDLMHAKTSCKFPDNVPRPPLGNLTLENAYYNRSRPYLNLMRLLEDYTNRTLAYSPDSLSAFQGILSSFESRKPPIFHVWGVPLVFEVTMWSLKLDWLHRQPCKRRPQFPSWSWAGWSGPITQGRHISFGGGNNFYTELEKDSQGKESEVISLQDFGEKHSVYGVYAAGSPFLQLETWTMNLDLVYVSWEGFSEAAKQAYYSARGLNEGDAFKEGLYVKLPRRGYTELAYFYVDDKDVDLTLLHQTPMLAMMYDSYVPGGDITFIALVQRGSDHYERMGYVLFKPESSQPISDNVFQLSNGTLSKVRPDVLTDEHETFPWNTDRRQMSVRLG